MFVHLGANIFCTQEGGGNKHFYLGRGGQTFFVGGGGAYDDVDEEMVVSEARKLSAGARIFRGP